MSDTLVVHLMIGIIGITAAFILNECESTSSVNDIREHDNKGNSEALTDDWQRFEVLECHIGQDDHNCKIMSEQDLMIQGY